MLVLVEPADGVDALGNLGEQVDDARPARWVEVGRNVALGLVDGVIDHRLEPDRLAVDGDPSSGGVDPRAELADDLAVDGDATLEDELLAAAARAQAGVGQHFLKPLLLVRLGIVVPCLNNRGFGRGVVAWCEPD